MTKPVGTWKLPQPTDLKEDNVWVPIPRVARTIPYGYKINPERQRKNKAGSLRRWADYAKKAIAKAEEIEQTRIGAKESQDNTPEERAA